jgi:hypothetical protein
MYGSEAVRIAKAQWCQTLGLAMLATGVILMVLAWNILDTATQLAAVSQSLSSTFLSSAALEANSGIVLALIGIALTVVSWYMLPK